VWILSLLMADDVRCTVAAADNDVDNDYARISCIMYLKAKT
jgi:hypothetical protein